MGVFGLGKRRAGEDEMIISGMRQSNIAHADIGGAGAQKADDETTVDLGFPTSLSDISIFIDEDIEGARRLLDATPEELMGSAALWLASADINADGEQASIAMAFMMMAQMRASSVGAPQAPGACEL